VLGALTAMYAIQATERALFVRLGCSHPPAAVRARHLLDQVTAEERNFAGLLAGGLQPATDASSAFRPDVPPFDWAAFFANPMIDSPQTTEYLGGIPVLDLGQCQSPEHIVRVLKHVDDTEGTDLSTGAARATRGDAGGALIEWGVRPGTVTALVDRSRPLTFHSVLDSLRTACAEDDTVPEKAELGVAIAAATLVAPLLAGGQE
jgi:hypothetical protein